MREIKLLLFSNKKIYFAYFALKHMVASIVDKNKNKMHVKKKKFSLVLVVDQKGFHQIQTFTKEHTNKICSKFLALHVRWCKTIRVYIKV